MKKLLMAVVAALWMNGVAAAVCTQETSGLLLKLPNYGDRGDVWARCVRDSLDIINDAALSTSTAANYVLKSTPVITGGLMASNWANFASSVTASAFYGDGTTLSGIIQSSATGTYALSTTGNAATATTATTATNNVLKAGDFMTGQLTTTSSVTAKTARLFSNAEPQLYLQSSNSGIGGELYFQNSADTGSNYAWKLWHAPSLADDLYLYRDGPAVVQSWNQDGSVGFGTISPTHAVHIVGGVLATSSVTAAAFHGDGAGLTTLTAANISAGTAGISITGNAATVTNGVYTTSSYANPAWITSLATSKIDLSTVTAALAGKLSNTATVPTTLIDLSTVTTALAGKETADATIVKEADLTANDFNVAAGVVSLDYTNGQAASAGAKGFLTAADWSTFNGKQAAGSYITALTGNVTASGPGSVAATIVSVPAAAVDLSTVTTALAGKQATGNYITALTGAVTASGPGSVAATIVSVPQAAVNLSTVTTALAGKLSNTATVPTTLVDLSTVTTALAGKQATGNYITALTGAVTASGPGSVAATIVSVPQAAVNLSTVTTALAGKLDTNGSAASLTNFPTLNQNTSGNAATATALAADPADCSGVNFARGVAASGAAACAQPSDVTGNAATATKLATARAINGVNFDGSAAINIATTSYLADGVSLALTGATFSAKASSVTLQGNTFNGASQLVKLDTLSKLPAVDGSALLNLPSTAGGAVLASTQTFTGANTFQSSVALSYGGSMRNSAFTLPTRHTVIAGTTTSAGYADFLNKTSGLFVHTYATAADPIVIAFAAGHNAYGPVDYIYGITASSTNAWAPAASTTTFLGVNLNATNNTITYVKTVHPLTYGYAAPSCNADRFFFSIPKMQMHICSGGVWVSTNTVFVGEAISDGSNVTSVITYALNGEYISPRTAIGGSGTGNSASHNIGVPLTRYELMLVNVTADGGWSPGEIYLSQAAWYQAGIGSMTSWADRLLFKWHWDGAVPILGKGATMNFSLTMGRWEYFMKVMRGF